MLLDKKKDLWFFAKRGYFPTSNFWKTDKIGKLKFPGVDPSCLFLVLVPWRNKSWLNLYSPNEYNMLMVKLYMGSMY